MVETQPVVETQSLATSAAVLTTMQALIHFADDQAASSDFGVTILTTVAIFRANPNLRIVIGYASQPGTQAYNLKLGTRRAESARSHLVVQGIAQDRMDIETQGETHRLVEGPGGGRRREPPRPVPAGDAHAQRRVSGVAPEIAAATFRDRDIPPVLDLLRDDDMDCCDVCAFPPIESDARHRLSAEAQ